MNRFFCFLIITFSLKLAAAAQQTPEQLGQLWVEAIRSQSIEKLKLLIHPNCPVNSVPSNILERMIDGALPDQFKIETSELGPKSVLEKIYIVVPDKQLNLKYFAKTPNDKKKFGLGKGFPIARLNDQLNDRWFFTVCVKSK